MNTQKNKYSVSEVIEEYPEFPKDCPPKKVDEIVRGLTVHLGNSSYPERYHIQVSSLIQLGTQKLYNRSSRIINIISITIAVTAIIMAMLSFTASKRWEKSQIEVLEEIDTNIEQINLESVKYKGNVE